MLSGKSIINFACVYASQPGFSAEEKNRFYDQLLVLVTSVASSETLVIAGDFNGHVGHCSQGFSRYHGGYGYGTRNQEGIRILNLCTTTDLAVTNTFFRKKKSQIVTFNSRGCATQVDYILVTRTDLKLVKNAKVIRDEECIPQRSHVLLLQKESCGDFVSQKYRLNTEISLKTVMRMICGV